METGMSSCYYAEGELCGTSGWIGSLCHVRISVVRSVPHLADQVMGQDG